VSDFKKGDAVKSNWGTVQTVEHVSPDGKYLWLMDSDGEYSTYGASRWTVVPKFFEAGKTYRSKSGSSVYVHWVGTSKDDEPVALAENLGSGATFALRSEHVDAYIDL